MRIAEYAVVVLLVVGLLAGMLAVRRVRSIRERGVHVSLRRRLEVSGRGWRLGVGHYRGDEFLWYRVLGLRFRPDQVIARAGLTVVDRREPSVPETYVIPKGATVLRCRSDTGTPAELELAMGDEAMTGFLSWLESAPPGRSGLHRLRHRASPRPAEPVRHQPPSARRPASRARRRPGWPPWRG